MQSYVSLVRANPAQARNGESALRMLMLVRGVNNMVQLEGIQTIGNLVTYLHNQILQVDGQGNPITTSLRAQILAAAGRGAPTAAVVAAARGDEEDDETAPLLQEEEGENGESGDGVERTAAPTPPTPTIIPKSEVSKLDLALATMLDLLKEVQCLMEIVAVTGTKNILRGGFFGNNNAAPVGIGLSAGAAGTSASAAAAAVANAGQFQVGLYSENRWATVQVLTVINSLLQILLNRNYILKYGKALGWNLVQRLAGKTGQNDGGSNQNSTPRRSRPGLVIPRVGASRGIGEAVPGSPGDATSPPSGSSSASGNAAANGCSSIGQSGWDWAVYLLQLFYWLRPVLMALSFTPSGLRPSLIRASATKVVSASSAASAVSIPTTNTAAWGPWRLWVFIEIATVFLSIEAQKRQPPTLLPQDSHASPTTGAQGAPLVGASTPVPFGIGGSLRPLSITHDTIGARTRTALRALFRDPFFTTVLRSRIKSIFTQSWLSKIPLAGPLLANTIQYLLDLQKMSFLATLGQENV